MLHWKGFSKCISFFTPSPPPLIIELLIHCDEKNNWKSGSQGHTNDSEEDTYIDIEGGKALGCFASEYYVLVSQGLSHLS